MNEAQNFINLETLADGAFAEKLNKAIREVAENIQDPNTEATAKRSITVTIKFAPDKRRHMVDVQINATTKLAATEAVGTTLLMGQDVKTGQIEISEWMDQLRGQMHMSDLEQEEEPEEVMEPMPETKRTSEKPLDLRNRGKKQEPEELPDTDEEEDEGENVVYLNGRAVQ